MSDLELIRRMFYNNEDVDMLVYTKLHMMLSHGIPVKLVFDEYGVSLEFKGQVDNLLLHKGPLHLKLGKGKQ